MSLRSLSVTELEALRKRIVRGDVECPLSPELPSLAPLHERAPSLFGLDRDGICALIDCVLAERQSPRPHLELVWTGPDTKASLSRDTAVIVREMFEVAQRCILVAGYSFDHGVDILQPMHDAMRRGVTAELFLNITHSSDVARFVDNFLSTNWPFGSPEPQIYYDPRTTTEYASIHAKCVVVDERIALVGSANFTDRGQTRNIEVGVRIDDPTFSHTLVRQWRQAIHQGLLVRCH